MPTDKDNIEMDLAIHTITNEVTKLHEHSSTMDMASELLILRDMNQLDPTHINEDLQSAWTHLTSQDSKSEQFTQAMYVFNDRMEHAAEQLEFLDNAVKALNALVTFLATDIADSTGKLVTEMAKPSELSEALKSQEKLQDTNGVSKTLPSLISSVNESKLSLSSTLAIYKAKLATLKQAFINHSRNTPTLQ